MFVPASRRGAVRRRLLAWWDAGHRPLPWRSPQRAADPYRVWVAEVMLQQTQVAAVVPYYQRFLARFPTLQDLAAASEDEVLRLWSGLGYYARGRRLLEAARVAVARHGGLPASREALAALPGFGPYTAGAVASIAFALPVPCVDGNVARVLARLFLVEGAPERRSVHERLWALAAELVPEERPGDFNQALMELGALVCTKAAPRCGRCPLAATCAARRAGRERAVPVPRRRAPTRTLEVVCALVSRGEAILLGRRPSRGLLGGTWELPSAAVGPGEDGRAALAREAGRLGLALRVGAVAASLERTLTHRRLRLTAYRCQARAVAPGERLRWVAIGGLDGVALSTAMRRLVAAATGDVLAGEERRGERPHRGPGAGRSLARPASSCRRTPSRLSRGAVGRNGLTRRAATV